MKFDITLLQQLVHFAGTAAELARYLTQLGLEVENITAGVIDLAIPPNRGDCLSILGIARELAAITKQPLKPVNSQVKFSPITNEPVAVHLQDGSACPKYLGCVIKNINAKITTPVWLQQALQQAGINPVSVVVDVTNYVMLELGQPMHAFDLNMVGKEIIVRQAKPGEQLVLLDQTTLVLQPTDLIIANAKQPLALAGIMGGHAASIKPDTTAIWLEAAYFEPIGIRLTARQHKITTESAYRFERTVDPDLPLQAMHRAIQLLQEIIGGQAEPIVTAIDELALPKPRTILLRPARVTKILGINLPDAEIIAILNRLAMKLTAVEHGWQVLVPSYRADLTREVDLIEEIARSIGYQAIPAIMPTGTLTFKPYQEAQISELQLKTCLQQRGYAEVITYSFIAPEDSAIFAPTLPQQVVINPISTELSVMRPSLLPGLVKTLQYNAYRQCNRIRIFELGLKFIFDEQQTLQQENTLAGLCAGGVYPEHWDLKSKAHDFFDVKGDIEALAKLVGISKQLRFEPSWQPLLHPGRSAAIFKQDQYIGFLGELHPKILTELELTMPVMVFEITAKALMQGSMRKFCGISKFPSIRRDLAIIVDVTVTAIEIKNIIKQSLGELLQDCCIFDVYCGQGIAAGKKSLGLGMLLQHPERTLVEDEVKIAMARVLADLQTNFQAVLR